MFTKRILRIFNLQGHDTTTAAMTFVYYNIAKYPDVQRKCFEEIRSVIGSTMHKKPLTLQDLSNLPYLELVIKEAMRMYPPVPLIGREILEETTISMHIDSKEKTKRLLTFRCFSLQTQTVTLIRHSATSWCPYTVWDAMKLYSRIRTNFDRSDSP